MGNVLPKVGLGEGVRAPHPLPPVHREITEQEETLMPPLSPAWPVPDRALRPGARPAPGAAPSPPRPHGGQGPAP